MHVSRSREVPQLSAHASVQSRADEGGEGWEGIGGEQELMKPSEHYNKVQECVCEIAREAEREVNLSVVCVRGERGGQQVVGFSPTPPLPYLFIHCWTNSSPSLLHKDPICLFCLSFPSPIISHSEEKKKVWSSVIFSLFLHFSFVFCLFFL